MIEYENLKKLNAPFAEAYRRQFDELLESGWFILGKQVKDFEQEFATYNTSKYCVGVANGLDALTLALKCFGFSAGAEVIVPSNTYIATILSILNCGLRPVLVEPDLATYNIDPDRIQDSITPKTAAIMVVHLYGKSCDMGAIRKISDRNNLRLMEDCAQSHGATFKDKKTGTWGDFGAFSFYPTKNLGALGDGGCITTEDASLARKMMLYRNYGSEKKYYNEIQGVNSRLDEIQAAFLRVKLRSLDAINRHKQMLAGLYHRELKDDFIKPAIHPDYQDVYHIYNIRHPRRDEVREHLRKHEIMTEVHYPVAPHRQMAMQGHLDSGPYPISEEIHATTLSLPISYFHTAEDIHRVIEVMNKF
jgi:dTDP-4-amino-4,6-dideoxygalactose transaminase